ncbi:MAG TPA: hypothetical protein VLG71_01800 [Candidatus Limnocylindria bacterium]|nr:hypothetical protein [Candidatus Limnocylindria bacterium]
MNRFLVIVLLPLLLIAQQMHAAANCYQYEEHPGYDCKRYDVQSHSFMFTRPLNQQLNIQQTLQEYLLFGKRHQNKSGAEVTIAIQDSVPFDKAINYFLFNCKTTLLVSGDDIIDNLLVRDIRAEWIGLPSNFQGKMTICPQQRQWGVTLSFNKDLRSLISEPWADDTWLSVDLPLIGVKNKLNLQQFDVSGMGTSSPVDIIEAFDQPSWQYGKIVGCRSVVRLAEINLKVGKTYLAEKSFVIAYYSMLRLPTGNQQNARYLFDAVSGNNCHTGIGAGVNFQYLLTRDPVNWAVSWFVNLEDTFFCRYHEQRTFDLIKRPITSQNCLCENMTLNPAVRSQTLNQNLRHNPWTRYVQLVRATGPTFFDASGNVMSPGMLTVPGVNVLTQEVRVRPFNTVDFSTGLRVQHHHVEFELGYNVWGHSAERIEFICPFPEIYGIAGNPQQVQVNSDGNVVYAPNGQPNMVPIPHNDIALGTYALTASRSTISTQAANDTNSSGQFVFVPIKCSDLDKRSAAAAGALNHKVHFALNFFTATARADYAVGTGFFFDYPQHNAALQLVGWWIKGGASF